ncbi:MAG: hypothetical protein HYT78_04920 [Deltaproteobacteria bacterium]|nr:hypothetical protein [Deltaproteobacteria bacterium]
MPLLVKTARGKHFLSIAGVALLLALISLLFQASAETIGTSSGYAPAYQIQKDFRGNYNGRSAIAVLSETVQLSPGIHAWFLETDYKQNLRVWPVVASQLIRSPPSLRSI